MDKATIDFYTSFDETPFQQPMDIVPLEKNYSIPDDGYGLFPSARLRKSYDFGVSYLASIFVDYLTNNFLPKDYKSITLLYNIVKDIREKHPEEFKDIPETLGDISKDLFGVVDFFSKKLNIGVFPKYDKYPRPFVKDPRNPFKKMLDVKRFSSYFTGFTIIPDVTSSGNRLVVIEIEGRDRNKVLEHILDNIIIKEGNEKNFILERTAGSIRLYAYISPNYKHNYYFEFPHEYLATVKIQSYGQIISVAPKDYDNISSNPYRRGVYQANQHYAVLQNGKQISWWNANPDLPVISLKHVDNWIRKDMRKVVIPPETCIIFGVSMFLHKRFHTLSMKLKEQTNSMYKIMDTLKQRYMPLHFRVFSPKANGKVKFEFKIESKDTIAPTPVSGGIVHPLFPHEPFAVTSVNGTRLTFWFDIVATADTYRKEQSVDEHLKEIYNAFKLEEETIDDNEIKASINSMFYIDYNENINIKEYVSEHKEKILDMYSNDKRRIMVVAPTGAGKTRAFLQTALDNNVKVMYAVPYTSQVEQLAKEYNIPGLYANSPTDVSKLKSTFVTTYDQLEKVFDTLELVENEWILVIDEVHNLIQSIDFRPVVKKLLTAVDMDKVIGITATPETSVDVSMWDYFYKFEYENKKPLCNKVEITSVRKHLDSALLQAIEKNGHQDGKIDVIFVKSTKTINKLESILTNMGYRVKTIYSYIKNASDAYKEIIEHQTVSDTDFLLTTSVIADGVNILNDNIDTVYIAGIDNGILIRQFTARFRKGYNKLHYLTVVAKHKASYYVPRYDVLLSSQLHKKEEFIKAYYKTGYDENIISLFGIDENADDLFKDMAIVNNDGLVIDRSIALKNVQNLYYTYLFNNTFAIQEFFSTFYMKPRMHLVDMQKDQRMVDSLSLIKKKMAIFESILKENPAEVVSAYKNKMNPSWKVDWENIAMPDEVSEDINMLMNDLSKYKHVAKTLGRITDLVSNGLGWKPAAEVVLKTNLSKKKLIKQIKYMAIFEVMDMVEYFDLQDYFTSYVDRTMFTLKHMAENSNVMQHQSFEAILEQAKNETPNVDIANVFQVPKTINSIKEIFRYVYDYKIYRPGYKRLVAVETDHRLRIKYQVMFDKTRHVGYKEIKRKTIESIANEMDLTEQEKKDLIQYLYTFKKAILGTVLSTIVRYIWKKHHVSTKGFFNLYYLAREEFGADLFDLVTEVEAEMDRVSRNSNDEYAKSEIYGVYYNGLSLWSYEYLQKQLKNYLSEVYKVREKRWEMAVKYLLEDNTERGTFGDWVGTGIEVEPQTQPEADLDKWIEQAYQEYQKLSPSAF